MVLFIQNKKYMDYILEDNSKNVHKEAFNILREQTLSNSKVPFHISTEYCVFTLVKCDIEKDLFVYEFNGTHG